MLERVRLELVALVVPPVCVACGAALGRAGESLCPACRTRLPWLTGARCRRCALPEPCEPCPARAAAYDRAWAPLAYADTARTVVTALKFRGGLALADLMAAQMAACAPAGLLADTTMVPVPARPAGRRERGFNQAECIARALARRSGRPLDACLRRSGKHGRQVGASRSERLTSGRIDVWARSAAPPAVVLVDDVHTTGATLHACARALRAGGAQAIAAITYARTLAPGRPS
ncbi:MAG: double zinc ribbon domain-containing protein [Actinomycetota bacterium]|nr:double zinc ribbon domain-containing protein [Actinomycetota bacterium]